MLPILWQEAINCARQLTQSRAFTLPAVIGLALGIGATTTIFSVYHALLLGSMGFEDVGRLVSLWPTDAQHGQQHVEVCYADLREWRSRASLLSEVALASSVNLDFAITGSGQPQQVESTTVTGNFFRLLGTKPAAGRLLRDDDDVPHATPRVVISHRLWRTRFGGEPGVVGTQLRSGTDSFTIVGVAAPEFDFPRDVDLWLPLRAAWPTVEQQARVRVFRAVGRMGPGAELDALQAQLNVVARQMAEAAPAESKDLGLVATPMLDEIYGNARTALRMIGAAVLLVLLIACANAANLLLARATLRSRELAVRAALGAGRARLLRLLLMDGVILALLAGLAGLLLAKLGLLVVSRLAPADVPRMNQIALDTPVLLFGVVLSLVTVLIFALAPAWFASGRDPREAFLPSGSRLTARRSSSRLRGGLIVLEVALSVVLLVGAGMLMRSFEEISRLDPGFDPSRVLTFRVTLAKPDQESRRAFYSQLLGRLRALPGVESAGAVLLRPLSGNVGWDTVYTVEGQSPEEQLRNSNANYEAVSPDYFRTMGIRLIGGRDFSDADVHTAAGVVIVNESTARRHWPHQPALGRHVRLGRGPNQPWLTVVGVVNDVRYREWEAVRPDFYIPFTQRAQHRSDFVLRTHGDPALLVAAVRREVLELDKDQPISNVTTMEALVDQALARSRFNGTVLSCLAVCALVLVLIGLYGVLSYTMAQRREELGIRLAVGASPGQMVRMVLVGGLRLTLIGVVAGSVAAWALSRLYASLLFSVSPADPAVYASAALGLVAVAMVACAVPALRASRLDPLQALRGGQGG